VHQVKVGTYQTLESFMWDKAPETEEHPAMYDLGASPNERHRTLMRVWDYTKDVSSTYVGQDYSIETEWVVDHEGTIAANGACVGLYRDPPTDEPDVDFFSKLSS
jgi:hypothetical protein